MEKQTWTEGFIEIEKDIYGYVTGGGLMMSNCCMVVGKKAALVFDVLCTTKLTQAFIDECRKKINVPIKYLVISHPHGDHFMGAKVLEGATVIGCAGMKEAFDADAKRNAFEGVQKRMPEHDFSDASYPYPDIYLSGDISIDLGEKIIELKRMGKCHTPFDLVMFVPDCGFLAGGDTLFQFVTPPTTAGDIDHWINQLTMLQKYQIQKVLPGHGPVADKSIISTMKQYFESLKEQAEKVVKGELDMDEEEPMPLEKALLAEGWKEAVRSFFSTEQYISKLRGEQFVPNTARAIAIELERKKRGY